MKEDRVYPKTAGMNGNVLPETATMQEVDAHTTFAELLEQYLPEQLRRGQLVEGQVLRISREGIIMDIGGKRDAIVPKQEVSKLSEAFIAQLTQGAIAPVVITHTPNGNEELEVSLRRGIEETEWQQADTLLQTGEVVERQVIGLNKGGALIEFGTLTGFVPNSHLPTLQYVNDQDTIQRVKEEMIGVTLPLKVIEINHQRRRLGLSRGAWKISKTLVSSSTWAVSPVSFTLPNLIGSA